MDIGGIIKHWRLEFKLSQSAFAKLCGSSQQTISRWENNLHTPSIVDCIKMAKALNLTLDEMFADLFI